MKKRCWQFYFVFLITVWPLCSFAGNVEIITFNYPPFMNENGTGLLAQIFEKVYRNTDTNYSFKVFPRKRAILVFNQPNTQGLFLGEKSYFPGMKDINVHNLMEFKAVFVYMKKSHPDFKYSGLSSLKGKRVGVSLGSVLTPVFQQHGMLVEEAQLDQSIAKLKIGRIDFWHTVESTARRIIDEKYPEKRDDFGMIIDQTHTVDLLVKKGSLSEPAFNTFVKGFNAMVKKGELQKIVKDFMKESQN